MDSAGRFWGIGDGGRCGRAGTAAFHDNQLVESSGRAGDIIRETGNHMNNAKLTFAKFLRRCLAPFALLRCGPMRDVDPAKRRPASIGHGEATLLLSKVSVFV